MLGSSGRRGCGPRTRKSETTWPRSPSQYSAPAATWPKPACQSSSVIRSRLPRRSLPRRRHRSPGSPIHYQNGTVGVTCKNDARDRAFECERSGTTGAPTRRGLLDGNRIVRRKGVLEGFVARLFLVPTLIAIASVLVRFAFRVNNHAC